MTAITPAAIVVPSATTQGRIAVPVDASTAAATSGALLPKAFAALDALRALTLVFAVEFPETLGFVGAAGAGGTRALGAAEAPGVGERGTHEALTAFKVLPLPFAPSPDE